MLQNALLDLLKAIVILVEDFLHLGQVEIIFGEEIPGKIEHQVQVVHLDGVLGHLGVHAPQLVELFVEMLGYGLGPFLFLRFLQQVFDVFFLRILTQFFLNCFQLLAQEVVALLLFDVGPDLVFDLVFQLQQL